MAATVRGYVKEDGRWDNDKRRNILPADIINLISQIVPPTGSTPDKIYWRPGKVSEFSVRSAYDFISETAGRCENNLWLKIWKWQVPEKIKYFMWLVSHERLITNALRAKRNIATTSECAFQCKCEESVLHILRGCERAKAF